MVISRSKMMLTAYFLVLLCSRVNGALVNSLLNKTITASTVHLPPMMLIRNEGNETRFSGPLYQEFIWLSQRLHFNYKLYQVKDNVIGTKGPNGTWDGIIGQIAKKEIDIALFPFITSLLRNEVLEHAGYYAYDRVGILAPYPTPQVSWTSVLQPFSVNAWIGWLISILAVYAACTIFVYVRSNYNDHGTRKILDDMFLYIFGTITAQGGFYRSRHRFLGVLATVWCLAAFVFVNVYNSTLTSYLATSYNAPEVNSMQQLADNPNLKLITIKGSIADAEILTATSGSSKVLGDRLRSCADCRKNYVEDLGRAVLLGGSIGVQPSASHVSLIMSNYATTKQCQLTMAQERYGGKHQFIGLPKTSPYLEEIRRETLWAHAFGLPYKWESFQPDFARCQLQYNKQGFEVKTQNMRLKLKQFYPAFGLMAFGYLFSLTIFLAERIYYFKIRFFVIEV